MNGNNVFLKLSIIMIMLGLLISSYFLYQFLYEPSDPLLEDQMLPIPTLDLETYERIRSKYE